MEKEINYKMYIGNYTNKGVTIFDIEKMHSINTEQGKIINNSYVCINKDFLYSVSEIRDENIKSGYISSYRINGDNLEFLNSCSSYGYDPCFITVNSFLDLLCVANYTGGSFAIYKIMSDGSIGRMIYSESYGKNSRVHQIQFSEDSSTFYVVDLGLNTIGAYSIQIDNGECIINKLSKIKFENEEKPRHLIIESENTIFLVTEGSCELIKIHIDKNYNMTLVDRVSILPIDVKDNYTGCAIKNDTNNKYIYLSIRGHNSISVFRISHNLELVQNISCEGICPRDLTLTREGKYLMCANQESNNISIFSINNGLLSFEKSIDVESPTCICIT